MAGTITARRPARNSPQLAWVARLQERKHRAEQDYHSRSQDHFGRMTEQVDRNDALFLRREGRFDLRWSRVPRDRIDIDKDWCGSGVGDGVGGGDGSECRPNHSTPWFQSRGSSCQLKACCPTGGAWGIVVVAGFSKLGFKPVEKFAR